MHAPAADLERSFAEHQRSLRAHCYRMLGSPFEAEDAVQEAFVRAWRGFDRFEGRSSLRSWLHSIATNVCLDMLRSGQRRTRPMDLGPAREPVAENLRARPDTAWLEPVPDGFVIDPDDPAELVATRQSVHLAFVAALQRLPPRQRAALLLCEVLQWRAAEVAELLDTTVGAVTSALQRARATLAACVVDPAPESLAAPERELLHRYVSAFEAYDMPGLTALIREDATMSMPPFDLWLSGRADVLEFLTGPGAACRGSRLVSTEPANGCPAWGQYKRAPGGGYTPWALQVIGLQDGRVTELTFFLDTERLFPLFGLAPGLAG